MDLINQIVLPLIAVLIAVIVPMLGVKFVNTQKRVAQAQEYNTIADSVLSLIRMNNKEMPLLGNIQTYKDQLFKALMGDKATSNSVTVNKRIAADAIVRAVKSEQQSVVPFPKLE